MELSNEDVERLEKIGFNSDEFSVSLDGSFRRLTNVDGHCYFYDTSSKGCHVYSSRPIGCRIYPVVFIVGEGIGVDTLCSMNDSVSELDLKVKGGLLLDHLRRMGQKMDCGL
jgi:Fe-S-cluster containining protein